MNELRRKPTVIDDMNFLLSPIKGALGVASALALGVFMTSAGIAEPQPELAIGSKAPLADVLMMNVNGTQMSLNTAAGPNGLLVVFSCNTCPFVVGNGEKSDGWEGRYNETAASPKKTALPWCSSTPTKPSATTTTAWTR